MNFSGSSDSFFRKRKACHIDEIHSLKNGRYVCLYCSGNPVLDSPLAVSVHLNSKRHESSEMKKLLTESEAHQGKLYGPLLKAHTLIKEAFLKNETLFRNSTPVCHNDVKCSGPVKTVGNKNFVLTEKFTPCDLSSEAHIREEKNDSTETPSVDCQRCDKNLGIVPVKQNLESVDDEKSETRLKLISALKKKELEKQRIPKPHMTFDPRYQIIAQYGAPVPCVNVMPNPYYHKDPIPSQSPFSTSSTSKTGSSQIPSTLIACDSNAFVAPSASSVWANQRQAKIENGSISITSNSGKHKVPTSEIMSKIPSGVCMSH